MDFPGDIENVLKELQGWNPEEPISNEDFIRWAGGDLVAWCLFMSSDRAYRIIAKLAPLLAREEYGNFALVSHSADMHKQFGRQKLWNIMPVHEAKRIHAERNLERLPAHLHSAVADIKAIENDEHAPPYLRACCTAWLVLIEEDSSGLNQLVFVEWAEEIIAELPPILKVVPRLPG